MMYRAKLFTCSLIAMGLSYGAVGCKGPWKQHDIDRCATIPSGAIPAPAGTHVNAWQCAQVASAAKDRGVFYQNEFAPKSSELSVSGQEHVKEAIQQSLYNTVPIVIEPSADPMLDQARLQSVHSMFASAGLSFRPNKSSLPNLKHVGSMALEPSKLFEPP